MLKSSRASSTLHVATLIAVIAFTVLIGGCKSISGRHSFPSKPGYYKDDGPGVTLSPSALDAIPDAVPRNEPLHRAANRPYVVFGRAYVPATALRPYRERGVASWYGRKFHGEKTSIGETYDMYAMTAAHPTLPLPSYARVTSIRSGKSVIVRVNDRGPFLNDRLIDLSYAAAHRIGIAQHGSGEVEVEAILPDEMRVRTAKALPPVAIATAQMEPPMPVEPVPAPSPAGTPSSRNASGFAVQLGAFANQSNAQNFLRHVQNQVATTGVEPKIRQANGLFKVYVGPFAQRDEAERVAGQLENAFGFTTTLAPPPD